MPTERASGRPRLRHRTRGATSGTLVLVVVLLAAFASALGVIWYLLHR